jgi:hypothetical protein
MTRAGWHVGKCGGGSISSEVRNLYPPPPLLPPSPKLSSSRTREAGEGTPTNPHFKNNFLKRRNESSTSNKLLTEIIKHKTLFKKTFLFAKKF